MKIIGILLAIIIFSLIIISHEAGHMLVAKRNGINVVEFSIGFGPDLISKTVKGTKYSIKLLPFGGACMMEGLDEENGPDDPKPGSYYAATVWQRMASIFAGPFANLLVAFLLSIILTACAGIDPARIVKVEDNSAAALAGLKDGDIITKINGSYMGVGRDVYTYFTFSEVTEKEITFVVKRDGAKKELVLTPQKIDRFLLGFSYNPNEDNVNKGGCEITALTEGYPIAEAGIRIGDIITAIDGHKVATAKELNDYMNDHPLNGSEVTFTYKHGNEEQTVTLTPKPYSYYDTGFSYNLGREKTDFVGVLKGACEEVRYWVVITVKNLGMLFTGKLSANDLGGAVAIVDMIGDSYTETVDAGGNAVDVILQLMYITILISADLFIMNLLPLPVLDGGKLLQLVVEAITRKPLNRKVEAAVNFVGLMFLLALMVFVFFNDIRRIITGTPF